MSAISFLLDSSVVVKSTCRRFRELFSRRRARLGGSSAKSDPPTPAASSSPSPPWTCATAPATRSRRARSCSAASRARLRTRPPASAKARTRGSSPVSNHVPCFVHTSTMTPLEPPKLRRFMSARHTGQATYLTGASAGGLARHVAPIVKAVVAFEQLPSAATSTNWPPQRLQSWTTPGPQSSADMGPCPSGHSSVVPARGMGSSPRSRPHPVQCAASGELMPKQLAQRTVATGASQCAHRRTPASTPAPHERQTRSLPAPTWRVYRARGPRVPPATSSGPWRWPRPAPRPSPAP